MSSWQKYNHFSPQNLMKMAFEISAGGAVYKKMDNDVVWLVTQHSKHKGWGFPKGLVADKTKNETWEEAAVREVREEGGVVATIKNPNPVKTEYMYRLGVTTVKKTVYYFLMEYQSGSEQDHDWEVADAKFLTETEVLKQLTYKSDKDAFQQLLEQFKRL